METKLLKVGDILYKTSHYKTIDRVVTIERVTNTQAIAGSIRFKKQLNYQNTASVIGDNLFSIGYWVLESEEIKDRHFRQVSIKEIKEADYTKASSDKLKAILEIINHPEV